MTDRCKERELAQLILGPKPSELMVIVCDSGITTTGLITSIALSVGVDKRDLVAIFSRRLRALEWGMDLLSVESGIPMGVIASGLLSREDWPLLSRAGGRLAESSIFISDAISLTSNEIRTKLHRYAAGNKRALAIIDDPSLIGNQEGSLKDEEIVDALKVLKAIASEIDQPIVVFAPPTLLGIPAAVEAASLVIHIVRRELGQNDAELSTANLATNYLQGWDKNASTSGSTYDRATIEPTAPESVALYELTTIREWLRDVFRLIELSYERKHGQL